MEPPKKNHKKDKVDMKERISSGDVISLKCIRFNVDEIMMIYISTKKDVHPK